MNENTEVTSAVDEAANGEENDGISLLIAFTPEWTARFNRPVLPLETLPSPVGIGDPPAKHIPAHGESGGEVCRLLEMTGLGETWPRGATFYAKTQCRYVLSTNSGLSRLPSPPS